MIRPPSWLLLMSLGLGITACNESPPPAGGSTAAAKSAAALMPPPEPAPERTFEIIPTASEMMARLRERMRDPADTPEEQQALQEVEAELNAFSYVRPRTLFAVDPLVEEPMGDSYLADRTWAAERLQALYGSNFTVSCLSRPCIHYGDFDADGRRDLVVQVADQTQDKAGIAFLMADQSHALLGAGRASPVGEDLLWMDKWRVVPRSTGSGSAVVLSTASQAARAELSLSVRKDGSRAVTTAWSCTATSQVPVMTGPQTPGGTVSRSGAFDGSGTYEAWRAFDASAEGTSWISESWTDAPVWIAYEWSDGPRQITRYSLRFANGSLTSRAPRDFELQGWNGGAWITLDRRTHEINWGGNEERHYNLTLPATYARYRLYVTEDNDARARIVAVSLGSLTLSGAHCDGALP